ncbi:protein involved in meta-pathway of phenol degradation-like protein [Formosa agariphila KMM 3901]|uniref:Protein involved in meta-pathway of phenol degradation-like protein n=1 Tax=Formosa agariphila (strain DSM 15362 / KCTC 12365 / LMG 23005 / KMM 3901 / M-2Alg 35-1) TaxID=1347342 RepID=T2KKD1_FORAG|nr:transporter [Formosa agariphila]CDF78871.1 protein involved in meta-pathway of phenol degradation-like protein [Formosa agariphila KMM 3901]
MTYSKYKFTKYKKQNGLSFFKQLCLLVFIMTFNNIVHSQNSKKFVSPLQTGHYTPGFLSIRDFADPAPASGIIVLDYNIYQYGDKFYNSTGDQLNQIGNVKLDSNLKGYINNPFLLYASKKKILGATYFGGVSVPYVTVNTNLAYSRIGTITGDEKNGNVSGKVSGFSDLNVLPLYLSWSKSSYNITAGYMFYAPTGKFELGGDDNTGLGYWSNIFQTFGYWYPQKIEDKPSKALAVMLGASYELTGKIKDSDVNIGDRFSLDYGIEQYLNEKFSVGIYGGNNWQVSKDKGSQVYWDNTVKDRLGIVGIQLAYWLLPNRLQAVGKWGFSYGAIERYQQNSVQINLVFITGALSNSN